jgi:hypothetical protein
MGRGGLGGGSWRDKEKGSGRKEGAVLVPAVCSWRDEEMGGRFSWCGGNGLVFEVKLKPREVRKE